MAEYIKRTDVEEILFGTYDYAHIPKEMQGGIAEIVLNKAESIDVSDGAIMLSREAYSNLCLRASKSMEAERIIHCRDCKHFINHDKRCGYFNHGVKINDYCNHGERKEE